VAKWESQPVKKVVQGIREDKFVLPVIQRSLVWNEEKMELLFDSLLKDNSFGGIMVLDEEKGERPLFAFRRFSREGEEQHSVVQEKLDQSISLVIDGQQRLQAFYMGLEGGFRGKTMYFNLYGTPLEYEFRFAYDESELPLKESDDDEGTAEKLWYPVRSLFNRLRNVGDDIQVANEIIRARGVTNDHYRDAVKANVARFHRYVFFRDTIGISSVTVNKARVGEEKQRIVELFRRLNDGGTRLSSFDLVAAVFKGFDYRMEGFFRDVRQFEDIGISQDEVIKLVFLLQDEHAKEVTAITAEDADFVIESQERIVRSLCALREFLRNARLYDYYASGGRSVIPLYFVAYHVFHKKEVPAAQLGRVYDNYDAKNDDFLSLKRWVYLSVLNGVFSRGKGWIPYRTGIRKILNVVKGYKGQVFPTEALFQVYRNHPLIFSTDIVADRLDRWDREFVFYLMYDCESLSGRDIDHIHPKSLLERADVPPHKIHSIANFQLLDPGTNRREKRTQTLRAWLQDEGVTDQRFYLDRHMIPEDETKWDITSFDSFLQARAQAIAKKVQSFIPAPIPPARTVRTKQPSVSDSKIDKEALLNQLPPEYRQHPILSDNTTWHNIYKAMGLNPIWTGRYRNELGSAHIKTVADFALFIMAFGLEFWYKYEWGNVFRFHKTTPDGQKITLKTKSFGGRAWSTSLGELGKRGFNWQEFVVNQDKFRRERKK